jgi:hypothetical protein
MNSNNPYFSSFNSKSPARILASISQNLMNLGHSGLDIADGFTYSKQLLTILSERRGFGLFNPLDMIVAHLGMLGEGKPSADFEAFVGNANDKS